MAVMHENTHQVSVTLSAIWTGALFTFAIQCGRKIKENIRIMKKYVIHRNSHTTMQQRAAASSQQ